MKPGTKSFESVDKEQKGRASIQKQQEKLRKIQTDQVIAPLVHLMNVLEN